MFSSYKIFNTKILPFSLLKREKNEYQTHDVVDCGNQAECKQSILRIDPPLIFFSLLEVFFRSLPTCVMKQEGNRGNVRQKLKLDQHTIDETLVNNIDRFPSRKRRNKTRS